MSTEIDTRSDHQLQNRPTEITVEQILEFRKYVAKPIPNFIIPGIYIPPHLEEKTITFENLNTYIATIRKIMNTITDTTCPASIKKIEKIITENFRTSKDVESVAVEILENFLVSDRCLDLFMRILNTVSPYCVVIDKVEKKTTKKIGEYFLSHCRSKIFGMINIDVVRELCLLDQDDIDQQDKYGKDMERTFNMINLLCELYSQRNTNNINVRAPQIGSAIHHIITVYRNLQNKLKELGDPYEGECQDEEEYMLVTRMCTVYGDLLYGFMNKQIASFMSDQNVINPDIGKLCNLVEIFKTEIIPSLTESYLISKCNDLNF